MPLYTRRALGQGCGRLYLGALGKGFHLRLWMGSLAALASAATFAMNLVLARVVYDAGGNLYAINLIRPFAFLACVLLVLRMAGQPIALPPGRRWASAGVGLLLTAELYAILGAIKFIPVSLAVLINYCYPLLIALFTWSVGARARNHFQRPFAFWRPSAASR